MIKLYEDFNTKTYYVVRYVDGRFLKILYVTKLHPVSEVNLVYTDFPCWKTEEEARLYIQDGEEVKYSYDSIGIDIDDFTIVKITI